jgi:hypothetical protein
VQEAFGPAQIAIAIIVAVLGGGGLGGIIVAVVNKKLRTPADDQARIEFGFKVLEGRLQEATSDRAAMQETTTWMRAELDKRDRDKAADFEEKNKLYDTIRQLEERIDEKNRIIIEQTDRMNRLATKLARGEKITIEDIFGPEIADLEDTVQRADLDLV